MAWTAPASATTGQVVTAAFWNAQVKDNMLETAAATAQAAGDLIYADAANSMGARRAKPAADGSFLVSDIAVSAINWRTVAADADTAGFANTNTSYIGLDAWGFDAEVEVLVNSGTNALVFLQARLSNNTAGQTTFLSYLVSGASSVVPAANRGISYESSNANDQAEFGGAILQTGLNFGNNRFTLYARVDGGTGTIARPMITVIPF